jgi:hypothetical protein
MLGLLILLLSTIFLLDSGTVPTVVFFLNFHYLMAMGFF